MAIQSQSNLMQAEWHGASRFLGSHIRIGAYLQCVNRAGVDCSQNCIFVVPQGEGAWFMVTTLSGTFQGVHKHLLLSELAPPTEFSRIVVTMYTADLDDERPQYSPHPALWTCVVDPQGRLVDSQHHLLTTAVRLAAVAISILKKGGSPSEVPFFPSQCDMGAVLREEIPQDIDRPVWLPIDDQETTTSSQSQESPFSLGVRSCTSHDYHQIYGLMEMWVTQSLLAAMKVQLCCPLQTDPR
ncbi:MAG: hypothetical protein HY324_02510, partial [Chlamydiia bacterium]|nr:hypothetical protein [Chlamydiia bacterium]